VNPSRLLHVKGVLQSQQIVVHQLRFFCATCAISITYPILRHMLGYTNDHQQRNQSCHLMTLGIQMHLQIFWHEYVQQCY
jgi:hypothetical protein